MKENILRVLLSVYIVFTFVAICLNNGQYYSDIVIDGLSQFSVQSDKPADELTRLVKSEADSAGFDIIVEDYETINDEGYIVFYKTNNTEDLLSIETTKGSTILTEDECFSNCDEEFGSKQYRILINARSKIIIFPFEEFCKRNKNISDFTVYCKTSEKENVFNSYQNQGLKITEYNSISIATSVDYTIQLVPGMLYLLAVILYSVHSSKKNTLMRMEGFSIVDVTIKEINDQLPCGIVALLSSILISAIYAKYGIKVSLSEYFVSGLPCYKSALITLALASAIRVVTNAVLCKVKYIKGAMQGCTMYILTSSTKTISVILLISSMTTLVSSILIPDVEMYLSLKKQEERLRGLVCFTQVKGGIEQSELSEKQFAPKLMEFYHDGCKYYDAIVCNTYDYALNENGKPQFYGNVDAGYGPSITVNGNYLRENSV